MMTENIHGIICFAPIYEYKGWLFEYHPHTGGWPLRKDGEPRKRAGDRFGAVLSEWLDLPEDEQKLTRVGGGCMEF